MCGAGVEGLQMDSLESSRCIPRSGTDDASEPRRNASNSDPSDSRLPGL